MTQRSDTSSEFDHGYGSSQDNGFQDTELSWFEGFALLVLLLGLTIIIGIGELGSSVIASIERFIEDTLR